VEKSVEELIEFLKALDVDSVEQDITQYVGYTGYTQPNQWNESRITTPEDLNHGNYSGGETVHDLSKRTRRWNGQPS
jgi:hypothetical protein